MCCIPFVATVGRWGAADLGRDTEPWEFMKFYCLRVKLTLYPEKLYDFTYRNARADGRRSLIGQRVLPGSRPEKFDESMKHRVVDRGRLRNVSYQDNLLVPKGRAKLL